MKNALKYPVLLVLLLIFCRKSEPTQETPKSKVLYVAVLSGLVLREAPNRSARPLTLIPFRTRLDTLETDSSDTIDQTSGTWMKTSFSNQSGFVFGGYLTDQEFFPEVYRQANADGSALVILEYDGQHGGASVCDNSYGPEPKCKIKLFKNGFMIHAVEGFDPEGWADNDHFAYGFVQGEHGVSKSERYEYNIRERRVTHSSVSNSVAAFAGDAMIPSTSGHKLDWTICSREVCTWIKIGGHTAQISGVQNMFEQKYTQDFTVSEKQSGAVTISLDGNCWKKVEISSTLIVDCSSVRATSHGTK